MNTIINSLSEADKNKSFLTVYKDGAEFDIKTLDFQNAIAPPDTLDIISNGTISTSSVAVSYQVTAVIPDGPINGKVSIPVTQVTSISFYGSPSLTATLVEFSNLTETYDFRFAYFNLLESISCPELKYILGTLQFSNLQLKSIKFPKLINAYNISFGDTPLLTEIDFSSLEICNNLTVQSPNPGILGFNESYFPSLTKGGFNLYTSIEVFEIDLPLVTTLTSLQGSFSKVNLPNLVNITTNNISVSSSLNLVEFNIGTLGILKSLSNGPYMPLSNNALNEESVNNLLIVLASLDGTNGTTICSNGNLFLQGGTNAAPSGDGLIAKSILLARSWYIETN
jgi:hypothetical protein